MPALTEARYEALRRARQAARVVLAKHPCVTGGSGTFTERRTDPVDQRRIGYEGGDLVRGEHGAGAGGSQ